MPGYGKRLVSTKDPSVERFFADEYVPIHIASGEWKYPSGKSVTLRDEYTGSEYKADGDEATAEVRSGKSTHVSQKELDERAIEEGRRIAYGERGIETGVRSFGNVLGLGLPDLVARELGFSEEGELETLQDENRLAATIGTGAGLAVGAGLGGAPGLGRIVPLGNLGKASAAIGTRYGPAAGMATEGALFGGASAFTDILTTNKPLTAEAVVGQLGSEMFLGGAIGGGLYGAGRLVRGAAKGLKGLRSEATPILNGSSTEAGLVHDALWSGNKGLGLVDDHVGRVAQEAERIEALGLGQSAYETRQILREAAKHRAEFTALVGDPKSKSRLISNLGKLSEGQFEQSTKHLNGWLEKVKEASARINLPAELPDPSKAVVEAIESGLGAESGKALAQANKSMGWMSESTFNVDSAAQSLGLKRVSEIAKQSPLSEALSRAYILGQVAEHTAGKAAASGFGKGVFGQLVDRDTLGLGAAIGGAWNLVGKFKSAITETVEAVVNRATKPTAAGGFGVPTGLAIFKHVKYAPGEDTETEEIKQSRTPELKEFNKRKEELKQVVTNPGIVQRQFDSKYPQLRMADPEMFQGMVDLAIKKALYLWNKLPPQDFSALKTRFEPSGTEIQKIASIARALEEPMSLLEDMKRKRLIPEAVDAVEEVYPSIMHEIRMGFIKNADKLREAPYDSRIQLGILFKMPLDECMTPNFLQLLQNNYDQTPPQDNPQSSGPKVNIETHEEPTPTQQLGAK